MSKEEQKLRKFLEKEKYTELINHYGVDQLVLFVEVHLLTPLKADLQKRNNIINHLKQGIEAL